MADFGVLHRNEISGALTGLTRVRRSVHLPLLPTDHARLSHISYVSLQSDSSRTMPTYSAAPTKLSRKFSVSWGVIKLSSVSVCLCVCEP
jgi:hypothetical protein